jgi:thiamine transport system ATP-binding protein
MLKVERLVVQQNDFSLRADFIIESECHIAVLGPSGAGKSTLLGAIGGYVPLKQGSVFVNGRDVSNTQPDQRGISMLFQDGNLFPHLTLTQNVGLGLRPTLRMTDAEKEQVHQALMCVGLAGFESRKPGDVSGGQQSRAALARMLVQAKPLMLLDEPFSALGPALRNEMLELTLEVAREASATIMIITHDPKDAERALDQILFVNAGQAYSPMPTADIMADPPVALSAYLGL